MYVGRREDGTIYGTWTSKQPDDADHPRVEELRDDDQEVVDYKDRAELVYLDPRDTKLAELESRLNAVDTEIEIIKGPVKP